MKYKQKVIVSLVAIVFLLGGFIGGNLLTRQIAASPDGPDSVPPVVHYQGTLVNPFTEIPVPDGEYEFTFGIYATETGVSSLWNEEQTVTVENGVFSVLLGAVNPLTTDLFSNSERYLGVQVGDDEEMVPRQVLASVPYAFQAENALNADTLDGMDSTDFTEVKQLIQDFEVASGKSVTAGDVVSFVNGYAQKASIAGYGYGSEYVFSSDQSYSISAAALSSNKFVVAYQDRGNSDYGMAVIGTVSHSTISYSSRYVFNSDNTDDISVAALSSTDFVVAYQNGGNSDYGTAVIGTVSDSTISYGPKKVFNSAATSDISAAALSPTKFVVAYQDVGNSGYGTAVIGNVTGSTISYDGPEEVFNSYYTYSISAAALSSTKFVVAYSSSNDGIAIIGTVSDSTISYDGSEWVFNSTGYTDLISAAALSSDRFVVAYAWGYQAMRGTAFIGTVSDSTIINYGSEYVFNSDRTYSISTTALSSTKFVVAYGDGGNSSKGTVVIGTVSDSDNISYGPKSLFNSDRTYSISAAALSSTKFVVAYGDGGNHDYGTAIIGTFRLNPLVGIARESGTSSETVSVIVDGVSDVHTGLTRGEIYYADASGNLSTVASNHRIGFAISTTEILLDMERF
ncbi:hypothetical protein ACFLWG_04665 [Chloroflexota bacterium]